MTTLEFMTPRGDPTHRIPLAPILVLALLSGCGASDDPAEAYAAYLDALARGRVAEAFAHLSSGSREALARAEASWRRRHRQGSTDGAGAPSTPGLAYFRWRLSQGGRSWPALPAEPGHLVQEARSEGAEARVTVETPGGVQEARLHWEEGAWKVVLTPDEGR